MRLSAAPSSRPRYQISVRFRSSGMVRRLILASSISTARRFIHGMTNSWKTSELPEIKNASPKIGRLAR